MSPRTLFCKRSYKITQKSLNKRFLLPDNLLKVKNEKQTLVRNCRRRNIK